eukprot:TRINITY_DN86761_c0_g1_i1.p1 TRINITY_DN86761_c0_g1~~TRINITY_DN86761_c0_g1_i1.p1  ORF type:complete len:134 (+),score=11.19 TRINITY_DN86761_c0_g1_i1:2-403(+)
MTNTQVFKKANAVPSHIEATVLRLNFMAGLLQEPEHHEQALTVFFQQCLPFESTPYKLAETGGRHLWAQRLCNDINMLAAIDDYKPFVGSLNGNLYKLIHDNECRQQFIEMDKSRLRKWWILCDNQWPFSVFC